MPADESSLPNEPTELSRETIEPELRDACEDVAVAHEDRAVDVVDRVLDRTRCAQRLYLVHVLQAHAVRPSVTEVRFDGLGQVTA